jgi:hypothetical protein
MVDYHLVDHPTNTFTMVMPFADIGMAVANESPLPSGASLTGVGQGCDQRVLFNSLTAKSIPAGTKKTDSYF